MKYTFLLIFLSSCITAIGQTGTQLVEISKIYEKKEIMIYQGLIHKYDIGTQFDTARYFNPGDKRWRATITFHEWGVPIDSIPDNPITDIPSIIDNAPLPGVVDYAGTGWAHATGSTDNLGGTWLNGTFSFNNSNNSYVTITWTGFRIQVYTEKKNTHGQIAISINNGAEKIKDLYTIGTLKGQLVYDTAFATHATRTIKIRTTNTKNPSSTQFWNILDYVKVYRKSNEVGAVDPVVIPPVDPPTGNVVNVPAGQSIGTVMRGVLPANSTVVVPAGVYIENQFSIPSGIKLKGAGKGITIIKSSPSFYYSQGGTFSPEKYLIQAKGGSGSTISDLTIDGDSKQLHGGIYFENRPNSTIDNVEVKYTNFSGIWLVNSGNSIIKNIKILDAAWGSFSWCSAGLQIANSPNVDVSNFDISENEGYGIKTLGHPNGTPVIGLKIHDGRVSVNPRGAWNDGKAPNISIEIWANSFPGVEIYNNYIDNTVSLVNPTEFASVRATPIKIYGNTFDINGPRTQGAGYAIELSINDAEVYNNFFNGGSTAMVNWHIKKCYGWNIHHNTFYNIARAINSQNKGGAGGGLQDIIITNNTVEMNSGVVGFVEVNGSPATNMKIEKNLFIGTSGSPKIVSIVAGGSVGNTTVSNNFVSGSVNTSVPGATVVNNQSGDPQIAKAGDRPGYWKPLPGSPLIANDIGALR